MIITSDDYEYIAFVKACLHEQFLWMVLVLFATFLELRFPPPLMASMSPKKSICRIFLVMMLLVMSALLRLTWISMLTFMVLWWSST
jgi:hypothetical protein